MPTTGYKEDDGDQTINTVAYMFAGLAMMLNIRLSYSAAPYALLRFKLPENLFSVFVRTTSSALELWCIPSMLIGNIMEQTFNQTQNNPSFHTRALKEKAKELETAAQELKHTTQSGAVTYAASSLANLAQALNTAANGIVGAGSQLADLQPLATELAKAAGTTGSGDTTSLYYNANQLSSDAGNVDTAIAVIDAFETVKNKYDQLSNHEKYKENKDKTSPKPLSPEQKVKEVENAWEGVKIVFDKLCMALIKEFAEQVETNAGTLAGSGGQSEATKVINCFNVVAKAYNALDGKDSLQTQFEDLQKVYSKAIYVYKFHFITIPSMFTNWLNFLTFVILLIVFVTGGNRGSVTGYYWIMAISGFVFGINMVLVYAVDYRYLAFYMAGENSFPAVTSAILYFATSIFGNRRKYNSDYLVVVIDVSIAILIAFVAAVLWTVAFNDYRTPIGGGGEPNPWPLVSPIAMVIVGMGLVYTIYPAIAPGMIVPFYLIDKIEMVLLVATAFPPVIIAILRQRGGWGHPMSPMCKWDTETTSYNPYTVHKPYGILWHIFDVLIPLQISLAIIFIYSLHYRDSNISRSIVNQPKMSTFLSIVFYMCHEILLALGFPGMVGNGGAGAGIMLPVQYVGALLMVFLAFYSIGYITEYKRHDPSQWPTDGMTKWNALCYWLKMASKITNKNFKQLFRTDLCRGFVI